MTSVVGARHGSLPIKFSNRSFAPRRADRWPCGRFLLAFHLPVRALPVNEPVQPVDETAGFAPNAFIRIDPIQHYDAGDAAGGDGAGRLHLAIHDPGGRTRRGFFARGAGACAAERCALRQSQWSAFRPPAIQLTVRAWWPHLRTSAPPRARAMLGPRGRRTGNGRSTPRAARPPTARLCTRTAAANLPMARGRSRRAARCRQKVFTLKDVKDFALIGKPLKRLDTPDKVNGQAVYGIDAMLPNMKFATLKACPVFGGKVAKVDDSAARKVPGVRKIVVADDFVAVVGDHMEPPREGLEALAIDWDEGPNARVNSKEIWDNLRAASEKDGAVAKSTGDIAKGLATGDRLEAAYELPFLAHATMEPINATVHLGPPIRRGGLDRHADR